MCERLEFEGPFIASDGKEYKTLEQARTANIHLIRRLKAAIERGGMVLLPGTCVSIPFHRIRS